MVGSETFKGYATLDGAPLKMPSFKAKTGVLSPDVRVGPWWVFPQIRVGLVGLKCTEMLRGEAECMFLIVFNGQYDAILDNISIVLI